MAEWLRWLISLSPLTIRSSHRCDWCGFEPHTGHKWDKSSSTWGCVRWFFPGYSRFCPTFWLARLDMSEIILKGTLNWTKKKKKKKKKILIEISNDISNVDHFVSIHISYRKNWLIPSPTDQAWGFVFLGRFWVKTAKVISRWQWKSTVKPVSNSYSKVDKRLIIT